MREFFFFTIKRACPTNKINLDQTTENTEDFFLFVFHIDIKIEKIKSNNYNNKLMLIWCYFCCRSCCTSRSVSLFSHAATSLFYILTKERERESLKITNFIATSTYE